MRKQVALPATILLLSMIYWMLGFQAPGPGQLPPREQPPPQTSVEGPPPIIPVDGKALYAAYCASCHGLTAKGDGPVAPELKHAPPDLTTIRQRHGGKFPRDFVEQTILGEDESAVAHGTREMPVWGPVFGQIEWDQDVRAVRVRNLTEYLESIQEPYPR